MDSAQDAILAGFRQMMTALSAAAVTVSVGGHSVSAFSSSTDHGREAELFGEARTRTVRYWLEAADLPFAWDRQKTLECGGTVYEIATASKLAGGAIVRYDCRRPLRDTDHP